MTTSNDPTVYLPLAPADTSAGAAAGAGADPFGGLMTALVNELYRANDFAGVPATTSTADMPSHGMTPDRLETVTHPAAPSTTIPHQASFGSVNGLMPASVPADQAGAERYGRGLGTLPGMEMPSAQGYTAPAQPSAMTALPQPSDYYFLAGTGHDYDAAAPALPDSLFCPSNLLDAGLRASYPDLIPTRTGSPSAASEQITAPPAPTVNLGSPYVRHDGPAIQAQPAFDVYSIRQDFPILQQRVHGKPLVWFDNAATTQKPRAVIAALSRFYEHDNSNIHRAAHVLAARATDAYEHAREVVRGFLGARSTREIVFVRGTTEAINLVAQTFGRANVGAGDEIVLTTLEHHANIVPWQMLCDEKGAKLRVVPITDRGEIMLEEYARLLNPRTKIVALAHVSNTLGTVLPVEIMTRMARAVGAAVLIDGAQSVAHIPVNMQAIDCDFYVLSGHKIFAPTGIGVLYGRESVLEAMPPWQGGGNMINTVTFEKTTYAPLPARFEAGTGILAGAVGLGAAIEYLQRIGFAQAAAHEESLLHYAMAGLAGIPGLRQFGTAQHKASALSFVIEGIDNGAIGKALDEEGIAVRVGHHCAQPTMARFGVTAMVRPSLALYNTREEVDLLLHVLHRLVSRRNQIG